MQGNGAGAPKGVGMAGANGDGNNTWKTWQSDSDIPSRKILIQHMYDAPRRHPPSTLNALGRDGTRLSLPRPRFVFCKSRACTPSGFRLALADPSTSNARVRPAVCASSSRGSRPRRRNGSRSYPTLCCASRRRCTAALAPRCAPFARPLTQLARAPESVGERLWRFRGDRFLSGLNPSASHRARDRALRPARVRPHETDQRSLASDPSSRARPRARARRDRRPSSSFFFARETFGRIRARNKMTRPRVSPATPPPLSRAFISDHRPHTPTHPLSL